MKIVKEGNLDVHDRKRFNELQPKVWADRVIEEDFDNLMDVIRGVRVTTAGTLDLKRCRIRHERRDAQ